MRRKIEISADGQSYTESASDMDNENDTIDQDESANGDNATMGTPAAGHETGGGFAAPVSLQAENEELRQRAEEAERRLAYAQAEFQNISKRKDEQYQSNLKFIASDFIKNLLPVLDNFERALKAAEQAHSYEALVGGVNGTLKQLMTALQKAGVTPIDALGQEFDPNFHEAIGYAESGEYPANTVAEEVQRGYAMHDRILRPTLVKVSQG